jgi:peptide deformylase
MALLEIRKYPDPILRRRATEVPRIDTTIRRLSDQMVETMYFSQGAGLAANQVGVPVRLIVVRLDADVLRLVNPEIVSWEGEEVAEEGCLSIPGFFEHVKRSRKVKVRGTRIDGKVLEEEFEGFFARVFQHEIDHINGLLFVDRLSPVKKGIFRKKYGSGQP